MPHFNIHYIRKWKLALPHFDVRICPECAALVFKQSGQSKHQAEHDHMRGLLVEFAKRTGMAEEELEQPWTWTAAVDGEAGPVELETAE